jgi:hypothetical protein
MRGLTRKLRASQMKAASQYANVLTPLMNCRCLTLISRSLTISATMLAGMKANAAQKIEGRD